MFEEDLGPEVMLCPATTATLPTTYPSNYFDANSDYIYLGAGLTSAAPADIVVAHDRPGNHANTGSNLLFVDSRVEWVEVKDLPKVFAAANTLRQKWERSRKIADSTALPTTRK